MNSNYRTFDNFKEQDRRDLFEAAAVLLGANAQAIEKDFWVCRVIFIATFIRNSHASIAFTSFSSTKS
jgi:hypothetical protein